MVVAFTASRDLEVLTCKKLSIVVRPLKSYGSDSRSSSL